jgi:hypothetical protein
MNNDPEFKSLRMSVVPVARKRASAGRRRWLNPLNTGFVAIALTPMASAAINRFFLILIG